MFLVSSIREIQVLNYYLSHTLLSYQTHCLNLLTLRMGSGISIEVLLHLFTYEGLIQVMIILEH